MPPLSNKAHLGSGVAKSFTTWLFFVSTHYGITGYGVFKSRDTKLERSLHKNPHTQRKLLNFENWTNGESQ